MVIEGFSKNVLAGPKDERTGGAQFFFATLGINLQLLLIESVARFLISAAKKVIKNRPFYNLFEQCLHKDFCNAYNCVYLVKTTHRTTP